MLKRVSPILISIMIVSLLSGMSSVFAQILPNVPRQQLLIVESLDGRITNPRQLNPYVPGTNMNQGYHQLALDHLWDINTVTGEWINALAAGPPEALDDTYTKWRIHLREGLTWSDGVEFTADDVVFTFDLLTTDQKLPAYGFWSELVDKAEVVDKYTLDLTLNRSYAKLQNQLGVVVWGCGFYPIPKHIWEDVDAATFDFYPPVSIGPYVLKDVDSNGYWFLWERREDWENTSVGQLYGEPKPKYVLFIAYGTEERRIISGAQHQLDVFCDVTPEGWEVLRKRNPHARVWYEGFPWAWMDDPCERGICFNLLEEPYNSKNVRWALTLASNIEEISLATFNGMLRISPLHIPPINVFKDIYFGQLEPWLREFSLDDGYQPFDSEVGVKIANTLKASGHEVPTEPEEAKAIFGIGWWKYDPDKAAELLTKEGFTRNPQGQWVLPDGQVWSITIVAPSNFEIQSARLAFAVAEQWRKFGIDVNVQPAEQGSFWTMWPNGTYEAGSYWPGCGQIPDIWSFVNGFHSKYIVPTGTPASSNQIRWSNSRIDELAEEMEGLPPVDPANVVLGREALKMFIEEMPYIPMAGTSKFVPVDTYYWDNWPTALDQYDNPIWWWSGFKFILPMIEPTGRK
jgi:peptide/nickel transport system substrate-binding protein